VVKAKNIIWSPPIFNATSAFLHREDGETEDAGSIYRINGSNQAHTDFSSYEKVAPTSSEENPDEFKIGL